MAEKIDETDLPHGRAHNFNAGPSVLPLEVLAKAQEELLNYRGSGQSVMELSHRGEYFKAILAEASQDIRDILDVPDNYEILFFGGGASNHFSAIPLNFIGLKDQGKADYVVTGAWSKKAFAEAKKYGDIHEISPLLEDEEKQNTAVNAGKWNVREDASYLYYCANETISGIDIRDISDHIPQDIPLVCDISSSFMSHPIDVKKFAVIFAGAQKNVGPSGLTIVIVRKDLLGKAHALCPQLMNYQLMAEKGSTPNTPPCFNIYMSGLVFKWLKSQRESDDKPILEAIQKRNEKKATLVYDAIDTSNGFFHSPIDKKCRSLMNITARIRNPKTNEFDKDLEKRFTEEAKSYKIVGVAGHRSVGGLRFSLYNALPLESAKALVDFMGKFQQNVLKSSEDS